jgi:putative glutamine amidotransferase
MKHRFQTLRWQLIFLAAGFLLLQSCGSKSVIPLRIAFSKGNPDSSYANYYNWIHSIDSTAICQDMYDMPLDSALKLFEGCSGLILTGGTDINPGLYGKLKDTSRCWPIDHKRDRLEVALFDAARKAGMPVLGICRGEQMINVALGGSLYVDLPTDFDTAVKHECADYQNCYHAVTVENNSILYNISGVYGGRVNSNHHQGIERLGRELKAVSYASDGLIEAVEWIYPKGTPFLLGVQWHPERMDIKNPLSGPIAKRFLEEAGKYCSLSENIAN